MGDKLSGTMLAQVCGVHRVAPRGKLNWGTEVREVCAGAAHGFWVCGAHRAPPRGKLEEKLRFFELFLSGSTVR